jgi:hypothetical protein
MRRIGALALCLPALCLPASQADDEAFRLLEARNAETLERDLRRAASDRFRLLATTQGTTLDGRPRLVALMEKIAPNEEAYDYAVLAPDGNLEEDLTLEALNTLGAAGYRTGSRSILTRRLDDWWLPEESYDAQLTIVLERDPAGGRYGYDSLRLADPRKFERQLTERWRDGYDVLALVNSARRVRAILERPLDAPPSRANAIVGDFRLLFNARRHGMRQELNKLAGVGYRLVAATEQSVLAPAMVLVQRRTGGGDLDYKVVSRPVIKQRKERLMRQLNKRAAQGFRVAPGGLTATDLALERPQGAPSSAWSYRLLSARRPPGLTEALAQSRRDGYVFVGLFADAIETVALVEKPL